MELHTRWTDSTYTKIKDYSVMLGVDPKTGFTKYKNFKTKKEAQDFINKNKNK